MTWKWTESPSQNGPKKGGPQRRREFFVKWVDQSYWHCDWISELQLDVFHPLMFRIYSRKYDMEEPPKLEEPLDEHDSRYKRIKNNRAAEQEKQEKALEEKFYKYVNR